MSEFNIFKPLEQRYQSFFYNLSPGRRSIVSASILNSSIKQRIEDIFTVLKGDADYTVYQISARRHYGLLDYFGFIIPSLLRRGLMWIVNHGNSPCMRCAAILLCIPMYILSILLWVIDHVIRSVLAALLTAVIAIPTILIIHPILAFIEHGIRKNINELASKELITQDTIEETRFLTHPPFYSFDEQGKKIKFWYTLENDKKYKLNKSYAEDGSASTKNYKEFNSKQEFLDDPLVQQIMLIA